MDWKHGPHGWHYTVSSLVLTASVIFLAIFNVGKAYDVWVETWMFFAALTGITTTGAVTLTKDKRRNASVPPPQISPVDEP